MDLDERSPDSKYGEQRRFDPTFKGPIYNRGCTDIICCILFIVAIVGYFAVGILAWSHGDPQKVIYPTDSKGQFCGRSPNVENKPYLFYFNIVKCASPLVLLEFQCPTIQLCVEKCPTEYMTLVKAKLSKEAMDAYKPFCKEGTDIHLLSVPQLLRKPLCPSMLIPSQPYAHRCLPALSSKNGKVSVEGNNVTFKDEDDKTITATDLLAAAKNANRLSEVRQVAMNIFEDYTQSWHWILLGLVIAMVISLIFVVLLRYLAGIMVWIMIVLVILVIGSGILYCAVAYSRLKGEPGADVTLKELGLLTDFSVYLHIKQTWLAFLIILCIVEVVVILLLIFLRKRIIIAIALIKEASRTIGHVMSSLFYPLLTFVMLSLVIAYWAITAVFLSTSKEQVYKVVNQTACNYSMHTCNPEKFNETYIMKACPDAECLFAFYGGETKYHKFLIFLQLYNVFLFFWCANFVTALGQVTLAGAFASYYWAFKKPNDIPANPVLSSLGRALRYHTGSLAFGSLILSIVQVIRVVLEYLDQKLKGAQNKCAKFMLTCLKCCFWCLEKFIKFLNRNAYIMIAIYGKNFCTSARDAFFLLMRNFLRVAVLDKVTDFLLFLGKLLIVGIVGIMAFIFFSGRISVIEEQAPTLNYYWVPIVTVVIGAYLIAHGFFSVYAMCVDTLFLCFCEDLERNDGSTERPYFMDPELHEILCGSKSVESKDEPDLQEMQSEPQQREMVEEIKLKHQLLQMRENEEENAQETILETIEEAPLGTPQQTDVPQEKPAEVAQEKPAEKPGETPVETPQETPVETTKESPAELAQATPVETNLEEPTKMTNETSQEKI
ncbi:choline transporter-like protein 2 isoform X1 [Anguilla rostrata]|uniref:choline transporter-like protein 2 isoform X1 n=1 Tax=Anguilla rostrata TaxID=7938 RepID=UPI0030CD1398